MLATGLLVSSQTLTKSHTKPQKQRLERLVVSVEALAVQAALSMSEPHELLARLDGSAAAAGAAE